MICFQLQDDDNIVSTENVDWKEKRYDGSDNLAVLEEKQLAEKFNNSESATAVPSKEVTILFWFRMQLNLVGSFVKFYEYDDIPCSVVFSLSSISFGMGVIIFRVLIIHQLHFLFNPFRCLSM